MAKKKTSSERKKAAVSIEALARNPEGGETPHAYLVMDYLVEKFHSDLSDARILIAKQMSVLREDADGTVGFGRVKRGNDLDREYAEYDFVLIIPYDMFEHSDREKRHAIIDSLLCQCAVKKDQHGEVVVDSKDRTVYRLRKPIKVFPENIRRYGLWQQEALQDSVAAYKDSKRPLLPSSRTLAKRFSEAALNQGESPPDTHLKNGESNGHHKANGKHANGHASAGKLASLDIAAQIVKACASVDLHTVDDVIRHVTEKGDGSLAEIKGIGSERAETLLAAVRKHQAEHQKAGA